MSNGFADKDKSYVGVGYIQYKLPNGKTKDLFVDAENASLSGIAKLINSDTSNGMRANVINDGSDSKAPWKLVISLEETGDGNRAEFPHFYFVDGEDDFFIAEERPAQDAKIKFDGFEIELPSNKVTDIIPGVTLDLKKAAPGEEFTLTIAEDTEAISDKVTDLIEKVNGILRFIKQQNTLDEKTDTSRTLGGDIMLQTLESRIRSVIFQDVKTHNGFRRIGDLGVAFQRDGSLKVDSKRLEAVLSDDYKTSAEILTGMFDEKGVKTPGFMDLMNESISAVLRVPDGLLQSRNRGLQTNIDQINRRIADRQRMLEQKEKTLKDKFSRLEGTISRIKGQGAGVAAMGASIPDPVQQLG
jgi:flagellar hook-associated protein 2